MKLRGATSFKLKPPLKVHDNLKKNIPTPCIRKLRFDPVRMNWNLDPVWMLPKKKPSPPLAEVGNISLASARYLTRFAQGQRSVPVLTIGTPAPSRNPVGRFCSFQ